MSIGKSGTSTSVKIEGQSGSPAHVYRPMSCGCGMTNGQVNLASTSNQSKPTGGSGVMNVSKRK